MFGFFLLISATLYLGWKFWEAKCGDNGEPKQLPILPKHPLLPDGYWQEHLAPGRFGEFCYIGNFDWPHAKASVTEKVSFQYLVPRGAERGILYPTYGNGGLSDDPLRSHRIMREARVMALNMFGWETQVAIARDKIEIAQEAARKKAETEQEAARNAELEHSYALAQAKQLAREQKLSRPIPLASNAGGIVFGTQIEDGADFVVPVRQMQHMLVSGVSGAGKTTFMHQILHQLLHSFDVDRLILIDLKGGVSFYRYRDNSKVEVYYEMSDVVRIIDELMPVMAERQRVMRETGAELYRGGRIFIVIDEYAEIQTELDTADSKEAKSTARRLAANLASIARRARALGIVIICALQRPTIDSMDAAVRNNLGCRICMRAATNQLAASMLDDIERLRVSPTTLPNGRFYYYDASRGLTRLLQAQIAPGVEIGGE